MAEEFNQADAEAAQAAQYGVGSESSAPATADVGTTAEQPVVNQAEGLSRREMAETKGGEIVDKAKGWIADRFKGIGKLGGRIMNGLSRFGRRAVGESALAGLAAVGGVAMGIEATGRTAVAAKEAVKTGINTTIDSGVQIAANVGDKLQKGAEKVQAGAERAAWNMTTQVMEARSQFRDGRDAIIGVGKDMRDRVVGGVQNVKLQAQLKLQLTGLAIAQAHDAYHESVGESKKVRLEEALAKVNGDLDATRDAMAKRQDVIDALRGQIAGQEPAAEAEAMAA